MIGANNAVNKFKLGGNIVTTTGVGIAGILAGQTGYLESNNFAITAPGGFQIGTSTFHAEHHLQPRTNYGFYTVIWDRLFGTLHPRYDAALAGTSEP